MKTGFYGRGTGAWMAIILHLYIVYQLFGVRKLHLKGWYSPRIGVGIILMLLLDNEISDLYCWLSRSIGCRTAADAGLRSIWRRSCVDIDYWKWAQLAGFNAYLVYIKFAVSSHILFTWSILEKVNAGSMCWDTTMDASMWCSSMRVVFLCVVWWCKYKGCWTLVNCDGKRLGQLTDAYIGLKFLDFMIIMLIVYRSLYSIHT